MVAGANHSHTQTLHASTIAFSAHGTLVYVRLEIFRRFHQLLTSIDRLGPNLSSDRLAIISARDVRRSIHDGRSF